MSNGCFPMLAEMSELAHTPAFWVGVAIVVIALLWGLWDVTHLSAARIGAIAKVVYTEGVRRGIWLVPIIAMIGVIVTSQLQKPIDEADAIRQTTKFCLFATGLVVVVTVMILACTNLPREIENRVIFTVVTKPATRLEIVAGKVWGFALVAALILLIMGAFSYAYLGLRATSMRRDIAYRLEAGAVDPVSRPALEHYRDNGLLSAKRLESPADFQIYASVPTGNNPVRWTYGGGDAEVLAGFDVTNELLTPTGLPSAAPGSGGLLVHVRVSTMNNPNKPKKAPAAETTKPTTNAATSQPFISPLLDQDQSQSQTEQPTGLRPSIIVNIYDPNHNLLIDSAHVNAGKAVYLPLTGPDSATDVLLPITPEYAERLANKPRVVVGVTGGGGDEFEYGFAPGSIALAVPGKATAPAAPGEEPKVPLAELPPATNPNTNQPFPMVFRGRQGSYGQQLRGDAKAPPVAVYQFRGIHANPVNGQIPVEMRVGIERTGSEDATGDASTKVELTVANPQTGQTTPPTLVYPENGRISYFTIPADLMSNGDFDVHMRLLTNEQWIGLRGDSLLLVGGQEWFGLSLLKSLGVLWLMSILVIVIAVFCSTFLSWPIAVVLTVVILLGHWGVNELGDATAPGIGNVVVTDIFGANVRNPAAAKAVSSSVEALSSMLRLISGVLPDIGQYSASEDLERGMVVPLSRLGEAAAVTFGFGLPLLGLAYIFMKNKEVAP